MQEFIQTHIQLSQPDHRKLKKLSKPEYPARWLRNKCLDAVTANLIVSAPDKGYTGGVRLSLRFTAGQRAKLGEYLKTQGLTVASLARHLVANEGIG